MIRSGILVVLALAGAAAIAQAACDPHPMEMLGLDPGGASTPVLGPDRCEVRAESATTATLRCGERSYHLRWVRA